MGAVLLTLLSLGQNAPIVNPPKRSRILLVAQAPGSTEITTWLLFTGPAGMRPTGWFERASIKHEDVCLSAVCRCFPSKARS
jgi:uracil-DNA glycosylase